MTRVRNSEGDEFNAVQFVADDGHPDVTAAKVEERNGFGPGTKAFIETKDTDGDGNIDGPLSSIADGTWVLTDKDGTVSLVHPSAFEREYEAV